MMKHTNTPEWSSDIIFQKLIPKNNIRLDALAQKISKKWFDDVNMPK